MYFGKKFSKREMKLAAWGGLLALGFLGIAANLYGNPLWWAGMVLFASGAAACSNVPTLKKWGSRLFYLLLAIGIIAGVGWHLYTTGGEAKVLQWGGYLLLAVVVLCLLEYVLRKAGFKPKPPHEQGDGVAHKTEPMHYKLPHEPGDEKSVADGDVKNKHRKWLVGIGVIASMVVCAIFISSGFSWREVMDNDWSYHALIVALAVVSAAYSLYKGKPKGMGQKTGLPKEPGDDSDVKNEYQHWHREK